MPAEPKKNISGKQPSCGGEASPAEDFSPAGTAGQGLDETIRKLQEDKKQLTDQLLRKQAELENFRKRTEREKDEFMQYSLSDAVKSLLPVLDAFDRALGTDGGGEEYRKGVALIHQQLSMTLQKLGLKPIDSRNQQFDPHVHEAVATLETDEYPDHQIVDELQRGYFFKDRLLRPAMVRVAKRRSDGNPKKNGSAE